MAPESRPIGATGVTRRIPHGVIAAERVESLMGDAEQEIASAQRRVWDAANSGDVALLEELIDDDFIFVEGDSLDRKTKSEFLEEVRGRSDEEAVLLFELRDVKVQVAGEMGVAYARFQCSDDIEGERMTMNGNAVEVFQRRGQAWKLVGSVYGEVLPYAE